MAAKKITRDKPFVTEIEIVSNWNKNNKDSMTTYLKSQGLKGKAESVGSVQFDTTKEWQKYGGSPKSFGKTDIKIGKDNISLKTTDQHLIFSGAKGEAKALFLSIANKHYKKKLTSIVNNVVTSLDDMVSGVTPSTIGKAKKTDYIVKEAVKIHESIKDEIRYMFTNDKQFRILCIKEMLGGELKFGKNSQATAEYVLYTTPELISIDDPKLLTKSLVDVRVDFKSQSAPRSGNVGNYRYWSVVQLIQKHFRTDEDINLISSIKTFIRNLFTSIKNILMDDWEDLFDFLDIDLEIT